ncbi:MAG: ComEC/Rec2 family competence protein [Muribaculaceae bacterium]
MPSYSTPLSKMPLVRIAVPFVAGVLLCVGFGGGDAIGYAAVALGVTAVLCAVVMHFALEPMRRVRWAILPVAAMSLSLGAIDVWLCLPPDVGDSYSSPEPLVGTVTDVKQRDASTTLIVQTANLGRVALSTNANCYNINQGDRVAFEPSLQCISNLGNPYEFDYRRYMLLRGVRYQQHITDVRHIVVVGRSSSPYYWLQRQRYGMRCSIYNSHMSNDAKTLCAALLLGYGEDIDAECRRLLSEAGVAHVVALSGMHVSLVSMFVAWLLLPLMRGGRLRLRLMCTIVAVLVFAFLTGLQPSVARASLMTVIALLSLIGNSRPLMLNALIGAVLLIVVFSPLSVFSVGLMLSVFAVLSLVVAMPWVAVRLQGVGKWMRYLAFSASGSVVATIAVSGITAYYFHTMSFVSVFSNFVVAPLLPLFMAFGALHVLLLGSGVEIGVLSQGLNVLSEAFVRFSEFMAGIPGAYVSRMWVTWQEVLLAYAAIVAGGIALAMRSRRWGLVAASFAAAVVTLHILIMCNRSREGAIVMCDYEATPVFYYCDGHGYVWCCDGNIDAEVFAGRHYAMLCALGVDTVEVLSEPCKLHGNLFAEGYAVVMGKVIVELRAHSTMVKRGTAALNHDYAIVPYDSGYLLGNLKKYTGGGTVIISAGLREESAAIAAETLQCRGVPHVVMRRSGAYVIAER